MIGNRRQYRSMIGWAIVAAVAGCLVYNNIFAALQQRSLNTSLAELLKRTEILRVEIAKGMFARRSVLHAYNGWEGQTDAMMKLLRPCTSREDFVIREGPRIAWTELNGTSDTSKKIGIYLPVGRHRLRYAVGDSGSLSGKESYQFHAGDPRDLAGVVSVELGPQAEVYEFEFKIDDEYPRISVIGRNNSRIHEDTVPLMVRPEKKVFAKLLKNKLMFPSEFRPIDHKRPYFLKPERPPITELGIFNVSIHLKGGTAMLRLWIESDARPCMPAIYVAEQFDHVTSLRYRYDYPPRSDLVTDPSTEFDRLFEPYDGTDRFYFRKGIFVDQEKN